MKKNRLGIIGGGQLGKMTAIAAKKLGYDTFLYCPKGDNPAEYSVDEHMFGNWDDDKKLQGLVSFLWRFYIASLKVPIACHMTCRPVLPLSVLQLRFET